MLQLTVFSKADGNITIFFIEKPSDIVISTPREYENNRMQRCIRLATKHTSLKVAVKTDNQTVVDIMANQIGSIIKDYFKGEDGRYLSREESFEEIVIHLNKLYYQANEWAKELAEIVSKEEDTETIRFNNFMDKLLKKER